MMGGSENRCIELANGISRLTDHKVSILSEGDFQAGLCEHLDARVNVVKHSLSVPEHIYNTDILIIVNTDVREFSTLDYWIGKTTRHSICLDINKIKSKMFFLYNFLISPAMNLSTLSNSGIDVSIISTNRKFFNEITREDRYQDIRILPRYILESPIDQNKVDTRIRDPREVVCFGMHSKGLGDKWNNEIQKLIVDLNKRYSPDQIRFRFMGIKSELKKQLKPIENVQCLDENQESVKDFLNQLDVFLFFPDWKREEPWARVIAESMVAGCPVIALDKGGTPDQVIPCHNGFLCKKYDDYYSRIVYLMEHKDKIAAMSKNSISISKNFYTASVIKRLLAIIE